MKQIKFISFLGCFLTFSAFNTGALLFAESADVKLKDINTSENTSIVIKKGKDSEVRCLEYQIIEGSDELHTAAHYDKSKARAEWKTECENWKKEIRELNKENSLLSLSCGKPVLETENQQYSFSSVTSYKTKVKMKEKEKE